MWTPAWKKRLEGKGEEIERDPKSSLDLEGSQEAKPEQSSSQPWEGVAYGQNVGVGGPASNLAEVQADSAHVLFSVMQLHIRSLVAEQAALPAPCQATPPLGISVKRETDWKQIIW